MLYIQKASKVRRREATPGDTTDSSEDGETFLEEKIIKISTPSLGANRKRGKIL